MRVIEDDVPIREDKDNENAKNRVAVTEEGAVIRLLDFSDMDWFYVEAKDEKGHITRGWIESQYVIHVYGEEEVPEKIHIIKKKSDVFHELEITSYEDLVESGSPTRLRAELVNFALQHLGNPYIWGGYSLERGADCSGFAKLIYKNFKVTIPRVSRNQARSGKQISVWDAKPGDLIFYMQEGMVVHTMLCLSNDGKHIIVVHSKGEKFGVVVNELNYKDACWAVTFLPTEERPIENDPYMYVILPDGSIQYII